ncbi:MAG: oligosaccharide flippase family protein [Mogibacterium sp.]|nr:oligosaccharide flippase family protein [Mogibacterium sp.]
MFRRLILTYHGLAEPIKASLWFTISSVIQRGISLLTTPIFTRLLTTEEYGVYSVYQSWYSIIIIFTTLNLYAGVYNNGMTKWPEARRQYTSALQGLSTTITILCFLIYLCSMKFWNKLLGLSTLFVLSIFIEVLFVPAFNFWASGQRFNYEYKKLVGVSVGMGIASPVLGVIAVVLSPHKAEARVLSYVFVQVCVGLAFYIYNMYEGKKFFIKKYWIFALKFNIPLIPHYLAQTVLNQADRIMIAEMVGKGEAAIYSVAYTISMMFTIVTSAINNTFIPYTYKAIRDKKYKDLKKNASFLVLFVGAACIVAMAFGPEIIRIFAAPEYYDARWVVPPVAEALLFMFIFPLFCNIEFYFEQTKFIMVASGLAAAINVGLNYVAIKMFGYVAAAYTTLICYILLAIAHYIAHRKICREEGIYFELYDMKFILAISAVSLCIMMGMTLVYDSFAVRYAVIAMIVIVIVVKRNVVINKLREIKEGNN